MQQMSDGWGPVNGKEAQAAAGPAERPTSGAPMLEVKLYFDRLDGQEIPLDRNKHKKELNALRLHQQAAAEVLEPHFEPRVCLSFFLSFVLLTLIFQHCIGTCRSGYNFSSITILLAYFVDAYIEKQFV